MDPIGWKEWVRIHRTLCPKCSDRARISKHHGEDMKQAYNDYLATVAKKGS